MIDPIAICSAANHTYTVGLAVALVSALRHAPQSVHPVKVYVLDGGIREAGWQRIADSLRRVGRPNELIRLQPDMARFAGLPQDWGSSVMTYARLALPEMVTDAKRLFYIDSDLVVQRDWTPVWETDLDGAVIAAAREVVIGTLGRENLPLEELGLNPEAPYLQAGVMLIDLPLWRAQRVSEQVLDYLRSHPNQAKHWDQSALNVMLYQQWRQLPDEWNVPAHWAEQGREGFDLEKASVLHYAGPNKPWIYGHHRSGSAARFFRVLDLTAWKNWRPSALRQALKWVKYRFWTLWSRFTRLLPNITGQTRIF
jgi:lipopolysaccharide biosynthesis glycosyltransferase